MKFLFVILPLIILLILRMCINNKEPVSNDSSKEYWAKEYKAMFSRNTDLSSLELFKPDLSAIPFIDSDDSQLLDLQNNVISASKNTMADLHELTNADIKIKYGNGNFPLVSKYDQNFMYFIREVLNLAKYHYNNSELQTALKILEYLVKISPDTYSSYTMLADIYKSLDEPEKINRLIDICASTSDSLQKESTLEKLREKINTY